MARDGLSQSTIPTFNTESSTRLNGLINNQILFCLNYLGQRRNFITVDEVSINNKNIDVQTAYNNKWIVDFPKADGDKYIFAFTGADYNINQDGFSTGKYFVRDKGRFVISKNGINLSATDWDFGPIANGPHPSANHLSRIFKMNTAPAAGDVYVFEYTEFVYLGAEYNIKMYRTDNQRLRATQITKSISDPNTGFNGYLTNASNITSDNPILTYTNFNGSGSTLTTEKLYPTHVRIAEFEEGFDLSTLDLELQLYRTGTSKTSKGDTTSRSYGAGLTLLGTSTTNSIRIDNMGSVVDQKSKTIMFRLFNVVTGEYSKFFNTKLSIRHFPVNLTDASLSLNNNVGFYHNYKLV